MKKSILHIVSSIDPNQGGVAESILQRGLYLNSKGHTVEVLTLDNPESEHLKSYPLKYIAIGPSYSAWRYSKKLIPWIKENSIKYDAIIVDGLWQYSSFAIPKALNNSKTRYYVFPHGMLDPWFNNNKNKRLKKLLFWHWADRLLLKKATKVLFTCEEERNLARNSFPNYSVNEHVVSFGTNYPPDIRQSQVDNFQKKYNLHGKFFLFLGRIHEKKGCDILIESFSRFSKTNKDFSLVIAGPCEKSLQIKLISLANSLQISDKITWTGMLRGEEKWSALHACHSFVLPSHQENFGIAVAEALSCGTPVIISDKVNIWREVKLSGAGLISPDTVDGTTNSMNKIVALHSSDYMIMKEKAQSIFAEKFSIEAAGESLISAIS